MRKKILIVASVFDATKRKNLEFFFWGDPLKDLVLKIKENDFEGVVFLDLQEKEAKIFEKNFLRIAKNLKKDFCPTFVQVGAKEIDGNIFAVRNLATAVRFLEGTTPLPNYYLK